MNTRLPVSIPTKLPALNPWFAIVSVNNPVWEIYVASVAVLCVAANILLPDAFVLIDPTPALTNRCSYAKSVIPIATVPPTGRYPEPNDKVPGGLDGETDWLYTVDPIPTDVITPNWFNIPVTAAPTNGATPNPPVDPNETILPPLGSLFWFISVSLIIWLLVLNDVIPVNLISCAVVPTPTNT